MVWIQGLPRMGLLLSRSAYMGDPGVPSPRLPQDIGILLYNKQKGSAIMQGRKNHIHPLVSPDSPENSFSGPEESSAGQKSIRKDGTFCDFLF
jgi:hypothetical protein